jgi:hypothetical protein
MAEEGGEEGTGGGMGGAAADISGSCSTSTGAGTGGPCSTSTATVGGPRSVSSLRTAVLRPCTSSPAGRVPRRGAVSALLATWLAPAGMHCLPRPTACRCGRRWLPWPRLALAGGAGSPWQWDRGGQEGWQWDKGGAATGQRREGARVWEKESPIYISSC